MYALTYDINSDMTRPTLELFDSYDAAEAEGKHIANCYGSVDIRIWELKADVIAVGTVLSPSKTKEA